MTSSSLSTHQRCRFSALSAALLATLLAGCVTSNPETRFNNDDPQDVCRVERGKLQETGNPFSMESFLGGLKGTLANLDRNIGKLAVSLTGFGSDYFNALSSQRSGQSPASMFTTFQGDLDRDAAQMEKTQLAFDALIDCRTKEIATVKASVKSGSLTRQGGDAKMADIRAKIAEDTRVARAIMGNLEERTANYAVAASKMGVPDARARAERAYAQKARSNSSAQKPNLDSVVDKKATQSTEAKKLAGSVTDVFAGTDRLGQKTEKLASLEKDTAFTSILIPLNMLASSRDPESSS